MLSAEKGIGKERIKRIKEMLDKSYLNQDLR
jgi:hypothetical protein